MAALLELDRVRREFDGGRIVAVEDVSLAIDKGQSVAITGPSGSGKSTLLNLICGLDRPTRGKVRFDGRGVSDRTEWARIRARRIGIVFQNFCLIPSLSARENVEIAMLGQVSHAHVRRARARMLLAEQGLAAREHLRPSELSGGERQRVAIARALANKPEMLIADEPTGSLDQRMSGVIMKVLTELERTAGLTLVVVTHDSSVAAHCARRIVLTDGRVTADSTAEPEAFRSADRMTGAANSP